MNQEQSTAVRIDFSHYIGTWINTYEQSRNIASFELTDDNGQLVMRATGVEGGNTPGDWGNAPCRPLAYSPEKKAAVAFFTTYELQEMDVKLSVNSNKGILIIAGSCFWKDGSDRADYFFREFYFQQ